MSEHGIGLKINAIRLGMTALIITKTKPTFEYGSFTSYLSIGLLSTKFIADAGSSQLIAPIVSFELKNKKIVKYLTPAPTHFLKLIA
jgi:hypothetical protein